MGNIAQRLTYANVASTLALVVAAGGGGTAVALSVADNSVGSPQIIDGSVKNRDLGADSVRTGKIANGSVQHADLDTGAIGVVRGYAWLEEAAPLLDTPVELIEHAYNSAGGDVTVTRTGTGVYTILFEGLGITVRNVQVTAYDNTPNHCKVHSWTGDGATVLCFDPSGALVNNAWQIAMIE